MLVVKHDCKKCGIKFELVSGDTLIEEKSLLVAKDGNQTLYLTVAKCPFCGYQEVVQVDNFETQKMFRDMVIKMRKCKNVKQSAKLKRMNGELDAKRKELFEKYRVVRLRGFGKSC